MLASLERNLMPDVVVRRLRRLLLASQKPKSQHYELPTSSFKLVLGKNLKCSCCYFIGKSNNLEEAEQAMLELYCERAQIKDGQTILDIGWNCSCRMLRSLLGLARMEASFDRVLSIEMFEHMKNYQELLKKVSKWMKQDSLLFVHYFCYKAFAYHFEHDFLNPIMESTYGKDSVVKWISYWRTFFISVAELFGYNNREEWMVAHFLF
ncbi:hypothetical protein NE237_027480 [Protea cynaroides]|uniref:Uncharacterized protein n=1 Tax=Protea cynaroides TaxID=273540 RepID=A0A9Q0GQ78_9MAGN|nr:hypothetical protein NE237_027480 [Protea cynaroides]